jgi:hypothetical protein
MVWVVDPLVSGLLGLVAGLAAGSLGTWLLVRRPATVGAEPQPEPTEPAAATPRKPADTAQAELPLADDELRPVIDASRSLLEDLERRYPVGKTEPAKAEKKPRQGGGRRRKPS